MFIDLHMHEKSFSKDSKLDIYEMIEIAKNNHLDAICITDHDSMGFRDRAKEVSKETGFPIFVGVEYYSLDGDIVAFGIDSIPSERIPAQEFIDYVHACGGVVICAHPFRHNRRGLEEKLASVKGIDAVEVLNGSTLPDAQMMAVNYAKKYGYAMTGGSDCHYPYTVGVSATYFPDKIETLDDLIQAIREKKCQPAFLQDFRYHVWDVCKTPFWEEKE